MHCTWLQTLATSSCWSCKESPTRAAPHAQLRCSPCCATHWVRPLLQCWILHRHASTCRVATAGAGCCEQRSTLAAQSIWAWCRSWGLPRPTLTAP